MPFVVLVCFQMTNTPRYCGASFHLFCVPASWTILKLSRTYGHGLGTYKPAKKYYLFYFRDFAGFEKNA